MGTLNRAVMIAAAVALGAMSQNIANKALDRIRSDNLNWIPRSNRKSGAATLKRAAKRRNNIRKHG